MKTIYVKGDIIDEKQSWIYDWLGWSCTTARKIINGLKESNGQPVTVKINSGGGSVFVASEIYTELRNYQGEIKIEIVGLCASAASVIAMAGKSAMSPTAQIMVHNVSTGNVAGDYKVMEHTAEVLKQANDTIANAYIAKSGISRETALGLMDKETWLTAQKAKELGLIDEIMFDNESTITNQHFENFKSIELVNSYSSIPKELLNKIEQINFNQPIMKNNSVDFFMRQKAQAQLNLLKLGGKNIE